MLAVERQMHAKSVCTVWIHIALQVLWKQTCLRSLLDSVSLSPRRPYRQDTYGEWSRAWTPGSSSRHWPAELLRLPRGTKIMRPIVVRTCIDEFPRTASFRTRRTRRAKEGGGEGRTKTARQERAAGSHRAGTVIYSLSAERRNLQ